MADKLNIRDLRFMKPALIYGWKVERWLNKNGEYAWYWDGDPMFPCKVGVVMEKMVRMGYMTHIDDIRLPFYRKTDKGYALRCRSCGGKGEHYDDEGFATAQCQSCNGLGLSLPVVKP